MELNKINNIEDIRTIRQLTSALHMELRGVRGRTSGKSSTLMDYVHSSEVLRHFGLTEAIARWLDDALWMGNFMCNPTKIVNRLCELINEAEGDLEAVKNSYLQAAFRGWYWPYLNDYDWMEQDAQMLLDGCCDSPELLQ